MQQPADFKQQLLDFPSDVEKIFPGLTAKAFAIPVDMMTDAQFLQAFKAFKQHLYGVGENQWSYTVPSFDRGAQTEDPYLQQMQRLIAQFTVLANQVNTTLRQEIIEFLQTHSDEAIKGLIVPPVERLSELVGMLQAQAPPAIVARVSGLMKSWIDTSYYTHFADRFGQKAAFIGPEPKFDADRERFYSSTKEKLETILFCYQQQWDAVMAPGVSAATKRAILSSIGGFLRELHLQSLTCQDGMAFISEAYDLLTKKNNPAYWLLEFRTAIAGAIVPGTELITGSGGYQIHAQTTVQREAAKLGFGVKCLPYQDRHDESATVKAAMSYAHGRLLVEFPFNYNYETVCDELVKKFQHEVKAALQSYRDQVVIRQGQRQPIYDELKIKFSHPPLSFMNLDIKKLLVHSAAEDVYRIDARLLDPDDFHWSVYFINQAQQLLLGLGIIQPEEKRDNPTLLAALIEAVEQRQLYRLYALLQLPGASALISPDLIRRALDPSSDQSKPLPPPQRLQEAPYQKSEIKTGQWRRLVLQLLLDQLPDAAFVQKSAADNLLVIAMMDGGSEVFEIVLAALVKRLAPDWSSEPPALPVPPTISLLEEDEEDIEAGNATPSLRLGDPGEQIALLRAGTQRLTAYANDAIQFPLSRKYRAEEVLIYEYVPQVDLPYAHLKYEDLDLTELVQQLRAIKTQNEITDEHCGKLMSLYRHFGGEKLIKTIYLQCGINALFLFQKLVEPAVTLEDAKRRRTDSTRVLVVRDLLEFARYIPVDLSAPRWLSKGVRWQKITPLKAALEDKDQQQCLQLLALGADPTVEQESIPLLILTAHPTYSEAVFAQLVQRASVVLQGQEQKARDFVNRRFTPADGVAVTALSVVVQFQQLKKLQFLLTRFKDIDVTSLPERQADHPGWDWLDLVVAVRTGDYAKAMALFLRLYHSVQTDQLEDAALGSSHLSVTARQELLAKQNQPLLEAQARLLLKIVQQQGGTSVIPFLKHLAQQSADVDLLLIINEQNKTAQLVDFNAPRHGVESLLHRAIRQRRRAHINALLLENADPAQLIQGDSALMCAVKDGGLDNVTALLAWRKPAIIVDQADVTGKHVLCHAAESSCSTHIFSALIKRFIAESKAAGSESAAASRLSRRTQVGLLVAKQLLQDQDRQAPHQIKKFIQLLTMLDVNQLPDNITDERDAIYYLWQLIRTAKAGQWATAIEYYGLYVWQTGIAVDDEPNADFLAMLHHQGCEGLTQQLAAQKTQPTGLLQVRALLQGKKDDDENDDEDTEEQRAVLAFTRFVAWVREETTSIPRPLLQSLRVLQHSCFPEGVEEKNAESPLVKDFIGLCHTLIGQYSVQADEVFGIVSIMVEIQHPEIAADRLVRWMESQQNRTVAARNDGEVLLASLRSLKTTILQAHSASPDAYQQFLCKVVRRLGLLLPQNIHHYPELFDFILQEVTDLCTLLFTHSSDNHTVYYSPFGYVIRAQLVDKCQDFTARHQRGEEVGMLQVADSLGRTPVMLAASLSWAPSVSLSAAAVPVASVVSIATVRERKTEVRETAVASAPHDPKAQEPAKPDIKQREGKQREIKTKDQPASVAAATVAVAAGAEASSNSAAAAASALPSSSSGAASGPPSITSSLTFLEQLLMVKGMDWSATDLGGDTVLHHAIVGPLENFVTLARHVQQHVPRRQWLALVRQPNRAGETILTRAVEQQSTEKVLGFLSMDIDVATLDVTPCERLRDLNYLYPLLQEIKRENAFYALAENAGWDESRWIARWQFTAFESLWQTLATEKGRADMTALLFTQLLQVLTADESGNHKHMVLKFYELYFSCLLQRYIKRIPYPHPAQPLLALLRLFGLKQWRFYDEQQGDYGSVVRLAFEHGYEDLATELIRDEVRQAGPSDHILQDIMRYGTQDLFVKVVALYRQYGGCAALNQTRILWFACESDKNFHSGRLMAIEGIDLTVQDVTGTSILETLLLKIRNYRTSLQRPNLVTEDKVNTEARLKNTVEVCDEFLKSETVLRYQYQKYRKIILPGSKTSAVVREAAVLSLHHLVRLGHLNLETELASLAAQMADEKEMAVFAGDFFAVRYPDMAQAMVDPQLPVLIAHCSPWWLNNRKHGDKTLLEHAIAHHSPLLNQLLSCKKIALPSAVMMQLIASDHPVLSEQLPAVFRWFLQESKEEEYNQLVRSLHPFLCPTPDTPSIRDRFVQQLYRLESIITTNEAMKIFASFCGQLSRELSGKLLQGKDVRLQEFLRRSYGRDTISISESAISRFHYEMQEDVDTDDNLALIEYYQHCYTPAEWAQICSYRSDDNFGDNKTAFYCVAEKGDERLVKAFMTYDAKMGRKESPEGEAKGTVVALDPLAFCKTTQMTAPLAFYAARSGIGACLQKLESLFVQPKTSQSKQQLTAQLQALTAAESKAQSVNTTLQQLWGADCGFIPLDIHIAHLKQMLMTDGRDPKLLGRLCDFFVLAAKQPGAKNLPYRTQLSDLLQQIMQPLREKISNPISADDVTQIRLMLQQIEGMEQESDIEMLDVNSLVLLAWQQIKVEGSPLDTQTLSQQRVDDGRLPRSAAFFIPTSEFKLTAEVRDRLQVIMLLIKHRSWQDDFVDESGCTLLLHMAMSMMKYPPLVTACLELFNPMLETCQLETWLRPNAANQTVMDYLLRIVGIKEARIPAALLMQRLTQEFNQITEELTSAGATTGAASMAPAGGTGVRGGDPKMFKSGTLSLPSFHQQDMKKLAAPIAVEMVKYYEAMSSATIERQAAASLRVYLEKLHLPMNLAQTTSTQSALAQSALAQPVSLDPTVWQVPHLHQLLISLGVKKPEPAATSQPSPQTKG